MLSGALKYICAAASNLTKLTIKRTIIFTILGAHKCATFRF